MPEEPPSLWRLLPILRWLPNYEARWLGHDAIAGLTLAAYAVPVAIAYATLAGLPPATGLYCYLAAGVAYCLVGPSRRLALGPTSAIAITLSQGLAPLVEEWPDRHLQLAVITAIVTAAIFGLAWALRFGHVVSFVSETILLGWKAGAALVIASTQLPSLLGTPAVGDDFFERVVQAALHLGSIHPWTACTALAGFLFLQTSERLLPARPNVFLLVVLGLLVSPLLDLASHGVATVGALTGGLPSLTAPFPKAGELQAVLPIALGCFLLGAVETISSSRALVKDRERPSDPQQELFALGVSNAAAALTGGFPIAGGMSQSAVNAKAGASTPVSLLVTSGAILALLVFAPNLLANLPKPFLGAIVLSAILGLINVKELKRLRHVNRAEFRVALVAFASVLLFGIMNGMLVACIASLLVLLGQAASPHVATLGRMPGTHRYTDRARHPDNELPRGVLVLRVEAGLYYFNVEMIEREILLRIDRYPTPVKAVVIDLSGSPTSDLAGIRMLGRLARQLKEHGIALHVAEVRGSIRDMLRAEGLDGLVEGVCRGSELPATVAGLEAPA